MARSTPSKTSDAPRDAIALLKQDHRAVEALFEQFEDADEAQQDSIAERVCQLLTVHAQIEEEIFYPAAKEVFDEEEECDRVFEAEVEHGSAKELIAKIEGMTSDDPTFKATVKVLSEYVKHHVREEENELFPAMRKTEADLKALGERLSERKYELMEQMGIEAEEEPATARKRTTGSKSRASTTRARQARAGNRSKSSSRGASRSTRH